MVRTGAPAQAPRGVGTEVDDVVSTGPSPNDLVPAAEFNVRDFARTAVGSHRATLDLTAYEDRPLSPVVLELLAYLAAIERATLRHLRTVLVTPTHKDARVTAFLTAWAYEKYWIADALQSIVDAHSGYVPRSGLRAHPVADALLSLAERFEPIWESVIANAIGEDVIAVHTTTGAVDELVMQAAYGRLITRADHPVLETTLTGLLAVKERHGTFFAAQSRDRLTSSFRAARLTRRRLARIRWPLGARDQPPELTASFYAELFDRDSVTALDEQVDAYPGLAGLALVRRSAMRAARVGGAR